MTTDIHHHCEPDNLGGTVEIAERIFHPQKLRTALALLKANCSDNALQAVASASFIKILQKPGVFF